MFQDQYVAKSCKCKQVPTQTFHENLHKTCKIDLKKEEKSFILIPPSPNLVMKCFQLQTLACQMQTIVFKSKMTFCSDSFVLSFDH